MFWYSFLIAKREWTNNIILSCCRETEKEKDNTVIKIIFLTLWKDLTIEWTTSLKQFPFKMSCIWIHTIFMFNEKNNYVLFEYVFITISLIPWTLFRGDQCPREAKNSWFVPTQFFVGSKFYFVDEILNKYMYIRSLESKSVGKGYRRMPRKLVPHERCWFHSIWVDENYW